MSVLLSKPDRLVRLVIFAALVAVAGGFGFFQAAVGDEISFAIFYLLPVAGATWFAGRSAGIIMAGVSGILALGADLASGREYSQAWIPVFNALVVCGFFLVAAYALSWLREALVEEARLAREDALTGLPNRRSFEEDLPAVLGKAAQKEAPLTFALVDLSGLEYVNDRWGDAAGDILLRVTGHTLRDLLREGDLLGRLGGTTFAVIFPGVGHGAAPEFLERIRGRVLSRMEGYDRPVSIAIAAVTVDRPGSDGGRVIRSAFARLERIKAEGGPHPFRVEREGAVR